MDDLISRAHAAWAEEVEQGWIGKAFDPDPAKPLNERAFAVNGKLVWPAETADDLAIYVSMCGRHYSVLGILKVDVGRIKAGTVCSVTLPAR